jgi:Lon protease-like protein
MAAIIELPLFPLTVVLFPGMQLPLHIFEERYRLMISQCLETRSEFGVVLIKSGREVGGPAVPFDIGTMAKIGDVQRKPSGEMDINVAGTSRFCIREVIQSTPYMVGRVELLEEDEELSGAHELRSQVEELVNVCIRHLLGVNGEWARNIQLPGPASSLSYMIAMRLRVSNSVKQELLEAPSLADRLAREVPLLETEAQRLRQIIMNKLWMQSSRFN